MPGFSRRLFLAGGLGLTAAGCWVLRPPKEADSNNNPLSGQKPEPTAEPPPPPGLVLGFPSPQTRLYDLENPSVFMPTASGRVESAWYGSTRTRQFGSSFLPAFHGGVDIAPTERDSRGRARDPVFAVADGTVGYINPVAGNSSYGIYIVLLHPDRLGEYYTLYSHLSEPAAGLKPGMKVERGTVIGRIGNTSTFSIPLSRSHLHLEVGTVLNSRFESWYRKQNLKPWHGRLHGFNLGNLNPSDLFPFMMNQQPFDFQKHVKACPVAFRMVVRTQRIPDYYQRYPALWAGGMPDHGAMVMDAAESGTPLQARAASGEEAALLQRGATAFVLEVCDAVLGRNGSRLVIRRSGQWVPGSNSERWLDILLHA